MRRHWPGSVLLLCSVAGCERPPASDTTTSPPISASVNGGSAEEEVFGFVYNVDTTQAWSATLLFQGGVTTPYYRNTMQVYFSGQRGGTTAHWGWYGTYADGHDGPCLSTTNQLDNGAEGHEQDFGAHESHCVRASSLSLQLTQVSPLPVDFVSYRNVAASGASVAVHNLSDFYGHAPESSVLYDAIVSYDGSPDPISAPIPRIDIDTASAYGAAWGELGPPYRCDAAPCTTLRITQGRWLRISGYRTQPTWSPPASAPAGQASSRQPIHVRYLGSFMQTGYGYPGGVPGTGTPLILARARPADPVGSYQIVAEFRQPRGATVSLTIPVQVVSPPPPPPPSFDSVRIRGAYTLSGETNTVHLGNTCQWDMVTYGGVGPFTYTWLKSTGGKPQVLGNGPQLTYNVGPSSSVFTLGASAVDANGVPRSWNVSVTVSGSGATCVL